MKSKRANGQKAIALATFGLPTIARRSSYRIFGKPALAEGLERRIVLSTPHLAFLSEPASTTAGAPINGSSGFQVAIEDDANTPIATDDSVVTLTINGTSGDFSTGSQTDSVAAVHGVVTFTGVIADVAGLDEFRATDNNDTQAFSNNFTINPAPASQLVFIDPPNQTAATTASEAGNFLTAKNGSAIKVEVEDAYGNEITGFGGPVSLTLNGGQFASGSTTASGLSGVAVFSDLTIDTAGTYTITATDDGLTGQTASFPIIPALPDAVNFVQQPTDNPAVGTPINPAVSVEPVDAYGNVDYGYSYAVTLQLNGGTFANGSSTITSSYAGGLQTFDDLTIDAPGNYTITASGSNGGGYSFDTTKSETSNVFKIGTNPTQYGLTFLNSPPATVSSGSAIPLQMAVQIVPGTTVTTDTSTVTLTLTAGTFADGSTTESAVAVNGVATFSNLKIDNPGNYFLTASDGSDKPASTSSFKVNALTEISPFQPSSYAASPNGLVADAAGDLFGETTAGGAYDDGSVFEIPAGSSALTTLVTFTGANGLYPSGGLSIDSSGDLFGSTYQGGTGDRGTVFEVANGATSLTTLASFTPTGAYSGVAGIAIDNAGDIFGTVGNTGNGQAFEIFEIPAGSFKISLIANFAETQYLGSPDLGPHGGITLDSSGDIFGTTATSASWGDIFEVPRGQTTTTTVASFHDATNGAPVGGLILDPAGDIFGTTGQTIFEIASGGTIVTTLATFAPGSNETESPAGSIIMDANGDIFGTTGLGPATGNNNYGYGTVFEVAKGTGTISILATFDSSDGANPTGTLVLDASGDLFGVTANGGSTNNGTVFELASGATSVTTLHSFGLSTASDPSGPLVLDSNGDAFGTSTSGGTNNLGIVFEIPLDSSAMTTIANFTSASPAPGLVMDSQGDIFGTTPAPQGSDIGGTVFEVGAGTDLVTTLVTFESAVIGSADAGLTLDASGDVFGVTTGNSSGVSQSTLFEIPAGSSSLTTLATLNPNDTNLVSDSSGDIFGTTAAGIYELQHGTTDPQTIAAFALGTTSINGLSIDNSGDLFYTTSGQPSASTPSYGGIYELPTGSSNVTQIAAFNASDGVSPASSLAFDANGDIFGTTASGQGTVFEIPAGSGSVVTLTSTGGNGGVVLDNHNNLSGTTGSAVFRLTLRNAYLSFVNPPTSAYVGSVLGGGGGINVDAYSGSGTLYSGDNSTINLTLSNGTFSDGHTTETAQAVNGVANFANLSINATGPYVLTASDGTDASTWTPLTVVAPTTIAVTSDGSPSVYGNSVTFTATVTPSTGSGATGTVQFLIDGKDALGPPSPVAPTTGIATYVASGSLMGAGTHSITAIYSGDDYFAGSTTNSALKQVVNPAPVTVELSGGVTAVFGPSDVSFEAIVTPIPGDLGPLGTVQIQVDGVDEGSPVNVNQYGQAFFPPVLLYRGTYSVTAVYSGDSNYAGSSSAAVTDIVTPATPTVAAKDAGGEYTGKPFPAAATVTGINGGAAATLEGVAPVLTYYTAPGMALLSGPPTNPGNYFAVATFPGSADYGVATDQIAFSIVHITVTSPAAQTATAGAAKDFALGSFVQSNATGPFIVTVNWGDNSPNLSVYPQSTAGTITAESHKYTIAGTYTVSITVTDAIANTSSAATFKTTVTPAAASKLVVTQQPTTGTAGVTLSPTIVVHIEDAFGNIVTTNSSTVTIALDTYPAGAAITGTATAKAVDGVATFTGLSLKTAGAYTFKLTDGSLTSAVTKSITIAAAASAKLAIVQQPKTGKHAVALSPVFIVYVEDAFGNVVITDTSSVTLSLGSEPSGGVLSGTATEKASKGIATFGPLYLSKAGTYTLKASDGKLTTIISKSIVLS